jgi:hypothetical protein
MAEGWKCPDCGLILAPHVNEHRCDPPGGVSVRPVVAPYGPGGGGGTFTWPQQGTVTVTTGDTYRFGTGGSGSYTAPPGGTVTVT